MRSLLTEAMIRAPILLRVEFVAIGNLSRAKRCGRMLKCQGFLPTKTSTHIRTAGSRLLKKKKKNSFKILPLKTVTFSF